MVGEGGGMRGRGEGEIVRGIEGFGQMCQIKQHSRQSITVFLVLTFEFSASQENLHF